MKTRNFYKPVLLAVISILFVLAACSPVNQTLPVNQETLESLPPEAVMEVVSKLSQDLGVSINEIEIVSFEQVDWPDSCLGVPEEGQTCAQVITPGYRVMLEVDGNQYEFHSNMDGTLILMAPPSQG
jgi:hypothetical protein